MKKFLRQFGGGITPKHLQEYEKSPQWKDGHFRNIEPYEDVGFTEFPRLMYNQFNSKKKVRPKTKLPVIRYAESGLITNKNEAQIIWYGHSALYLFIAKKHVLIDPMFGPDTTPIAPFASRRFSENTLSLIDEFPLIDIVLLTHDHYDHLDLTSIELLKTKVKKFIVGRGLKRHLMAWGVNEQIIIECDWWDTLDEDGLTIHYTPTRHFSGRGLRDRRKCLWGGWVFEDGLHKIWFSGDGGYGAHFKEIGNRLGPFDFGMMECGQYCKDWPETHMFPKEAVKAAIDAGVKKAMPVHWGAFSLSYWHDWNEPPEVFSQKADELNLPVVFPALGQSFDLTYVNDQAWWIEYD